MIEPEPFLLERYFAEHEFSCQHMLSSSDCQTLRISELLALAGRSLEEFGAQPLGYSQSEGTPALVERIAASHDVSPESVVVGAPQELINLLMGAVLGQLGQRQERSGVVVMTPCYQSLMALPIAHGAEVSAWDVERQGQSWAVNLQALDTLLQAKPALVVVNLPHNPTGAHLAAREFAGLIERVTDSGALLFSDEMYRGLELSARQTLPAAATLSKRAISLGGLSKAHGLPGLRIGWLVLHDDRLRRKVLEAKDYTTICSAAPSQWLAEVALSVEATLIEGNRKRIATNRGLLQTYLDSDDALLTGSLPQAGPLAFLQVKEGLATTLAERVREKDGLLIPSTLFGFADRYVRIGLGRDGFAQALACLAV